MSGTFALLQSRLQDDVAEASLNAIEEGAPMVQVASLFNQLLHHFPRLEFAAQMKKHQAERAANGSGPSASNWRGSHRKGKGKVEVAGIISVFRRT